ncbi:MAG: mechanosensitive ion channel family protein [Gammaproteobacteria bacterium]|nr:mechanosensitive ion channel family protein [Gammaproteobacteria bacterium]
MRETMDQNAIKTLTDLLSFNVIVVGVLLITMAWLVVHALDYASLRLSTRFPKYRLQISRVFPIARLLTWVTAFYILVVDIIHPPQNTALAILASAGLAIGLAAQDPVRNILSGILILFDQPFRVGDMIRVGEYYGEVVRIDTRTTRVRTFDDNIVSFPNSLVLTQAVANSNSGNLDELVMVTFHLPAYIDTQLLKNLFWEAAAASPYVYLRKGITVLVEDQFNRSFLTRITVKCYVIDVRYERLMHSDITENIKSELIKLGLINKETVIFMADQPVEFHSKNYEEESTPKDNGIEKQNSRIIS